MTGWLHARRTATERGRLAAATLGLVAVIMPAAAEAGPKAVVELFTSQGCSSCPPADAVLGRLAEDPDVLALSLAVDYWDYLGWKDSFARDENTARQRDYAMSRGDNAVYTPQAVINGRIHVVGSDEPGIRSELADLDEENAGLSVEVKAILAGDRVIVKVPAGAKLHGGDPTIWLVSYSDSEQVEIGRGENTGRSVTYHNIVRRIQPIGMWAGEELVIEYPVADLMRDGANGCAVLLQTNANGRIGAIVGAATVKLPTS